MNATPSRARFIWLAYIVVALAGSVFMAVLSGSPIWFVIAAVGFTIIGLVARFVARMFQSGSRDSEDA